jgi:thioredoxin 1
VNSLRAVSDSDFEQVVAEARRPVLVDFWAEWCGPCRGMGPILEALAAAHAEKIDVVKVNLDEAPLAAARYDVSSIPALLLFDAGSVVETLIGAKPRGMIEKALQAYLA